MTLGRALAIDTAKAIAFSAIPDAALEVYGQGRALGRAGQSIATGAVAVVRSSGAMRAMTGRGRSHVVAGEFVHGPGDRAAALAVLAAGFDALMADIHSHATSSGDAAWALAEVLPTFAQWTEFDRAQRGAGVLSMLVDWSAYEQWWERLRDLRELAAARGIHLDSALPAPLPETIWQRGAHGTGTGADRWFTAVKWAVYAALGLFGLASLWAGLRAVRREALPQ